MLTNKVYDRIRPTGSQRPQMYGLPKIHKLCVPPRAILYMIGSAQHELAKWLSEALDPVLQKYSKHCIKDSFTFAEFMQNFNIENKISFMCSFDISSLFTNVALFGTIKICADALYRSELNSPPFPEELFIEVMETATRSVEFRFLTSVYRKPTFLGLYTRWSSFCPKQRKISLIKTLSLWELMICSGSSRHLKN